LFFSPPAAAATDRTARHANEIDVERVETAQAREVVVLQLRVSLLDVQGRTELDEQLAVHERVRCPYPCLLRLLAVDRGE
jgi:hypothetical protein